MLRMLDRHAVQAMLQAGERPRQSSKVLGISVRTVWRIAKEPALQSGDDAAARRARGLGRPPVAPEVTTWLTAEPDLPPGEVHRRLREAGHARGLSTVHRLLGATRPTLPPSVLVRFESVAGEFAQFDFGHVEVRLVDDSRRRVHFAAYRLKWSRFMCVTVVPNERIEALIRSLLAGLAACGTAPRPARTSNDASRRADQSAKPCAA